MAPYVQSTRDVQHTKENNTIICDEINIRPSYFMLGFHFPVQDLNTLDCLPGIVGALTGSCRGTLITPPTHSHPREKGVIVFSLCVGVSVRLYVYGGKELLYCVCLCVYVIREDSFILVLLLPFLTLYICQILTLCIYTHRGIITSVAVTHQ